MARAETASLNPRTRASGRTLVHLRTCGSTNDVAAELAASHPHGLVVLSDHQSAGRGRHGRVWHADAGAALLFSVALHDAQQRVAAAPGLVALAGGLSVAEALDAHGIDGAQLRWPNDVEMSGRKVAGVLVERRGTVVIVGIGVNLTQSPPPDQTVRPAGHLTQFVKEVDRRRLLAAILERLGRWWQALQSGDARPLVDAFSARCVTLGRRVRAEGAVGAAVGLDGSGRLLVETGGQRSAWSDSDKVEQQA